MVRYTRHVQTGSAMLDVQSLETRVGIMGAGNTVGTNYHRENVVFYKPCTAVGGVNTYIYI